MCVSNCNKMPDGDYQSCSGCDVYVSCVAGRMYADRPCAAGGLSWDDNLKRCEWTSATCNGCVTKGQFKRTSAAKNNLMHKFSS